jgi:hypothetical protein
MNLFIISVFYDRNAPNPDDSDFDQRVALVIIIHIRSKEYEFMLVLH